MKIENLGKNVTVVTTPSGLKVLYSYSTAVACYHPKQGFLKTDKFHSRTTSKHINAFCGEAETRPQAYFDTLI